jgi:hypothetical protein
MLGFLSAHIPWNVISNLELRRSFNALCTDLILPSTNTLSNISHRKYTLTIEAIKKQLPTKHKVSVALDWWTSTNKLAILSVIGYYIDHNWSLRDVHFACDEVYVHPVCDCLPLTNHRSNANTQESGWLSM